MATEWISPTWRMPNDKNQSKFENYSLDFTNTSSERIILDNSVDLGLNSTISLWVNFDITGSVVLGENSYSSDYLMYVDGTNIYIRINSVFYAFAHSMATGQWYNIVVVRQGDSIEVFQNNTSLGTQTGYGTSVNTKFNIIGASSSGLYFVNGKLSEVVGFDYTLSESQRNYLYNSGTPINPMAISGQPPVAYYPLGGSSTGSASTLTVPNESVADATVFDFDGTNPDEINCGTGIGDIIGDSYTGGMGISLWFKTDSTGGGEKGLFIFSGGVDAWGEITAYFAFNNLYIRVKGVLVLTHAFTDTTSWHNLLINFLGPTESNQIYLDGAAIGSPFTYTDLDLNGETLNIGYTYSTTYDYQGQMSNFQVWNTSLSAPDVTTLYNNGVPLLSGTQPQAANLKAWYPMNVDNANWLGSDWQIADAVSAYPQSFNFVESSTQYIDIGTNNSLLMPTDEMSISLWVNFSAAAMGNTRGLFSANSASGYDGYVIWKDNNDKIAFLINDGSWKIATRPTAVVQDTWYHVVGTWDGSTARIYVNNVDEGNVSVSSINYNASTVNRIGDYANDEMDGNMSNVQFWNKGLSAVNVTTLYNNGSPLTTAIESSNLKAWYKLDNTETYLTPNSSQTQNLYEGWLVENQAYPASIDKSLLFGLGTDVRYNGFYLSNQPEITYSFWWMNDNSINSWDLIVGNTHGTYYNFRALQNRSGAPNVYGSLKTNDGAGGSNTATVYLGNITTPTPGWRLLTFTYDGSTLKAYLNETEIDSASITGSLYDVSPYGINGEIGIRDSSGSTQGMRISNLIIWNKGLTGPEVSTLYNNGTPLLTKDSIPQDSSMLLWNTLENKTETIGGGLYDKSGNSVAIKYLTQPDNITISTSPVSAQNGVSSGMAESNLVNNNVSALNGTSSGMTTANLVNSDLTRSIPYSSYSMDFDGASNEYINCGYTALTAISGGSSTLSTPMTISMWFKLGSSSSSRGLLNFGSLGNTYGGFTIRHQSSVLSFLKDSTNLVSGGYTFTDTSSWHHLSFIYDPSDANNCYLYIDGVDTGVSFINVGNIALQNTNLTNRDLIIGAYYGNADTFTGSISNCSIYNKLLTTDEVLTIYNGGVPNSVSSLSPVGWWSLAGDSYYDGTNFILPDLSANSNNGTSANMSGIELVGNGPGSSANGTATNMDIPANLKGDAPNSSSNAFSVNMDSQDRVASVPS